MTPLLHTNDPCIKHIPDTPPAVFEGSPQTGGKMIWQHCANTSANSGGSSHPKMLLENAENPFPVKASQLFCRFVQYL